MAWFALMVAVGAGLLARHLLPLPVPHGDSRSAAAFAGLRAEGEAAGFRAVHVLASECACSRRIVEHLVGTVRPAGVVEHVLLVGDESGAGARLSAAGFRVLRLTPAELSQRFHVEAAPMLFVTSPDGEVRYAGGYTERKQGPEIRDLAILEAAAARPPISLPVFGCAVSDRLRRLLNPLLAQ